MSAFAISSRSLSFQVWHHFKTVCRHHYAWLLTLIIFFIVRHSYRVRPHTAAAGQGLAEPPWVQSLAVILTLLVVSRLLITEPAASTDLYLHTRPIRRAAIWWAKFFVIFLAVITPQAVLEIGYGKGFGLSPAAFLALAGSAFLFAALPAFFSSAVAAPATSPARLVSFIMTAFLGMTGGQILANDWFNSMELGDRRLDGDLPGWPSAWMAALPYSLMVALLIASWVTSSVGMRKRLAWLMLVGALVVSGWAGLWTEFKWQELPQPAYAESRLALHTGRLDTAADAARVQSLWPALHVTGIPEGHTVSVLSFKPVGLKNRQLNKMRDPKAGPWFWSDGDPGVRMPDMANVIFARYPKEDLWLEAYGTGQLRTPLAKVLGPAPATRPWELLLAVHQMTPILDVPLAELKDQERHLSLYPGERIRLLPLEEQGNYFVLRWQWQTVKDRITPTVPELRYENHYNSAGIEGLNAMAVIRDESLGENLLVRATSDTSWTYNHNSEGVIRQSRGGLFHLYKPLDQMELTGLELKDWMQRVRLQLWCSRSRGVTRFELAPEVVNRLK